MLDPTMLRVVGQQCCVRLHGPLVLCTFQTDNWNGKTIFKEIFRKNNYEETQKHRNILKSYILNARVFSTTIITKISENVSICT